MSTITRIRLSPNEAMNYVLAKHHVPPGFQSNDLAEIVHDLFGLHAARLPTPYTTLFVRSPEFESRSLWEVLYVQKQMIKLRCMRRTLHILPLYFAPIAHKATISFRVSDCLQQYKKLNADSSFIEEVKNWILNLTRERSVSSKEIESLAKLELGCWSEEDSKIIRIIIKELWESGELCYINQSDHWGREERLYGNTSTVYPDLKLNEISVDEAQKQLVYHHISRFGPVTEKDISWWSGLSIGAVRKAIQSFADDLIIVELDQSESKHYMMKDDLDRLSEFRSPKSWVSLLAYEDPTLKGYFESRFMYVHPSHYDLLFNKIGESRASIIVNGRVVGIWELDKKERKIHWNLFEQQEASIEKQIRYQIDEMSKFLFS